MAPQHNLRAVAWMIGAAAAFSLLVVCVRELSAALPTPEILFFRCLFTTALLIPWAVRAGWEGVRMRRPWPNLLRGVSTFAAMTMWFHAIGIVPLADAVAIQSAYPLFTILLAMLLFAERPGIRRGLATLAGFAGVLVIVRPGFEVIGLPTAMLLGAAWFYAVSNICVKAMADTESPTRMVFTLNFLLLVFSAVPTAFVWTTPDLAAVPWIVLLAGSGFAAHMCLHAGTSCRLVVEGGFRCVVMRLLRLDLRRSSSFGCGAFCRVADHSGLGVAFQLWKAPDLAAVPWIVLLSGSGFAAHMCLIRAPQPGAPAVVFATHPAVLTSAYIAGACPKKGKAAGLANAHLASPGPSNPEPFAALNGLLLYGEIPRYLARRRRRWPRASRARPITGCAKRERGASPRGLP